MTTSSADRPLFLLIDDDPKILEIFGDFFKEIHNFEVITAKNEEEAILCVESLTRPAVVILDRIFCNSKGDIVFGENLLPLLRQRARFPIITIFHSGDNSTAAQLLALRSGAYWYLPKGGDIDLFVAYVWLAVLVVRRLIEPTKDPLTKALNRTAMFERVTSELSRAERLESTTACLFFDIDKLKIINDSYGHATGDSAIVCVVDSIRKHLRPTDLVCRHGGDEIVVFLFDAQKEWVQTFADDACRSIGLKKIPVGRETSSLSQEINTSVSVGIATLDPSRIRHALKENKEQQGTSSPSWAEVYNLLVINLIAEADRAMYSEKKKKREGVNQQP